MHKISVKTKNARLYNDYKRLRNKVTHLTKLSHKRYIDKRVQMAKNKSKIMWKIINGTLHINKISKVKISAAKHVTNSFDIANSFNNFFVNVGKSMSDKIPNRENVIQSPRVTKSFVLSETDNYEICKLY